MGETLYTSEYQPDPKSAIDVLAFVLTPVEAFANPSDEGERAAVAELLGSAKQEAVERYFKLRTKKRTN